MVEVLQLCQLLNLKYQQVKDYYIEFMAKLFPFSQITIWNCRWNIRWCSWNTWIHIATTRGFGTSRVSLGSVPMVSSIKSRLLKREFMFLSKHILGKQDSITYIKLYHLVWYLANILITVRPHSTLSLCPKKNIA